MDRGIPTTACASTRSSCCSTPTASRSPGRSTAGPEILAYDVDDPSEPSQLDSAPAIARSVVVDPTFDWEGDAPIAAAVARHRHLRAPRQGLHPAARPDPRGAARHLCRPGAPGRDRLPQGPRRHRGRAAAGAPVLLRAGARSSAGLTNYWGYNSIGFFAPDAAYSSSGDRGQQVTEFKQMVKSLHRAGIEVILDVVYNHTAEAAARGSVVVASAAWTTAGSTAGCRRRRRHGATATARRRPTTVRRHLLGRHRLRQHGQRRGPAGAAADPRLAALLGDRDARRRLPVRPDVRAHPHRTGHRHVLQAADRDGPGPGAAAREADRRAVGRLHGRLPGRPDAAAVGGVERPVPRHDPRLLARPRQRHARRRHPARRLLGPLRRRRPVGVQLGQLRHRARRVHHARPGLLRPQAQRGQRRGQPRRHRQQPVVEPRGRGRDRRQGDRRAAPAAGGEPDGDPLPLQRRPDADRRRRARPDPGRQQQRLLPGQRDLVGGLERRRRRRRLARRLRPHQDRAPAAPRPPDAAATALVRGTARPSSAARRTSPGCTRPVAR